MEKASTATTVFLSDRLDTLYSEHELLKEKYKVCVKLAGRKNKEIEQLKAMCTLWKDKALKLEGKEKKTGK